MQDIDSVFSRLQESKAKLKELRKIYKDALDQSQEHQELKDKIATLRDKKKQSEQTLQSQFSQEMIKMDDLKIDIASDEELLSDIALTKLMKGETVEIADRYEQQYEPVVRVRFKKVK